MLKIFRKINSLKIFRKNSFTESADFLHNPCRGWFSLYTFSLDEEPDYNDPKYALKDKESLVLVLVDIGAFNDRKLEKADFLKLDNILDYFKKSGKDIILRVAYDHEGKGMEREPSSFRQVLEHAGQIASYVEKNKADIFIYQGLLVGRWGEMHTSRYLSEDKLRELYRVFDNQLNEKVYMAVRRPVQWRTLKIQPDAGSSVKAGNLGIFNDGMFGSDSDLGTFDSYNKDTSNWYSAWNRENETDFIGRIGRSVPVGGEALFGEGFINSHQPEDYIKELEKQNITYLNRYHDRKLMEYWQEQMFTGKGVFYGKSCLEYIGAHLGYRFIIDDAEVYKVSDGYELTVLIKNTGFANIYKDTNLYVEYEGTDGREIKCFEEKLNLCFSGTGKSFSAIIYAKPGNIYIFATQEKDGKTVYFANTDSLSGGKIYAGEIRA